MVIAVSRTEDSQGFIASQIGNQQFSVRQDIHQLRILVSYIHTISEAQHRNPGSLRADRGSPVTFTMAESAEIDAVAELIKTYNELNSPYITELDEEPSPLEFMRFVARNTPFVIRGGAAEWKATQTWSAQFLEKHLEGETVNVAVTPLGYASLS